MDTLPPSVRQLASKLLAANRAVSGPDAGNPPLLNDTLRTSLTRFVGVDGYAALLRRALSLAGEEFPRVRAVTIAADGRLEGLDQLVKAADRGTASGDAEVTIATNLLGLLVTFIGESLTLSLVREAWPGTILDE
jgi:hypothetical protein